PLDWLPYAHDVFRHIAAVGIHQNDDVCFGGSQHPGQTGAPIATSSFPHDSRACCRSKAGGGVGTAVVPDENFVEVDVLQRWAGAQFAHHALNDGRFIERGDDDTCTLVHYAPFTSWE